MNSLAITHLILCRFAETLNRIARTQTSIDEHSNQNDWVQMQFITENVLDGIECRILEKWKKNKKAADEVLHCTTCRANDYDANNVRCRALHLFPEVKLSDVSIDSDIRHVERPKTFRRSVSL